MVAATTSPVAFGQRCVQMASPPTQTSLDNAGWRGRRQPGVEGRPRGPLPVLRVVLDLVERRRAASSQRARSSVLGDDDESAACP